MAKFALFILTHKRPHNQITLRTLRRQGYTGKVFMLCDTKDPELETYIELYGDMVKTFSKKDYVKRFDRMTNEKRYNAVVYARNAVCDVARELGLDYIIVMDDDYSVFNFSIDATGFYKRSKVKDLDKVFRMHLRFLAKTGISTLAFGQGGDFIGGWNGSRVKTNFRPVRKAMNVFFINVNKPVQFNGMINEDSTMGVQEALEGRVVLTNLLVQLEQTTTQAASGGLTDIYKDAGTYQKSFYTLLANPSAVRVSYLHGVGRVHHVINGDLAYPKILSPDLRK